MLRPVSILNEYKYSMSDIIITVEGSAKQYIISADKILQLSIVHRYTEHIYPYIKINSSVEKDVYKLLSSSPEKLTMKVSLYKYISSGTLKAKEIVFSKSFKVLNEYELQPSDTKFYTWDTTNRQDDPSVHNTSNQFADAAFYLIDSTKLSDYQKIKSYFLTDASITDAIALMFSNRGYKELLMNTIPGDIVGPKNIPAYNLMASLEYLNTKYGLFNTEYIFYMDIVENYLLDKTNLGKAIRKGKPDSVNLFLEKYGTTEAVTIGSIIDKNAYVINMAAQPTINNIANFIPYISGSNIVSINTNDNIVAASDKSNDKAMLVFNSKIPKQINHTTAEAKITVTTGATSIDISAIAPNLLYTIVANQDYNTINKISGDYRLNGSMINLVHSGDKEFGLACTLELILRVKV